MTLIERIKKNETFQIFDEKSGETYFLEDLPDFSLTKDYRALIFCYLDNSFNSISFLLKALETHHVLVLLSITLADNYKNALEGNYLPNYIFDASRFKISGYKKIQNSLHLRIDNIQHVLNDNLKVLLSTSGTTGSPKFVKLSETNLLSNAESIASFLPILNTDRVPLNLPLHYSYGLSLLTSNGIVGATLYSGCEDIVSKDFWNNFQKYKYTTLAGVPFVYEILNRIGFTNMNLDSLRYFTQAGGKLRNELVKKFGNYAKKNEKLFYVMYGQTEATARMSYLHPEDLLNQIGSIGKPIPNGRFELHPETSELLYEGPNVFGGYCEHPKDLETFENFEVLNTGDLAKVDEKGFYYITGRSKRIVKVFGNRINLDELESVLSKNFRDLFYCVGWQDKFILIFSTNAICEKGEIVSWLSKEYKLHSSAFRVKSIASIPQTVNGKVDYNSLIRDYDR